MNPSIGELSMAMLRQRGRLMLAIAIVALAPALALTNLFDVLGNRDGAIVNGQLVPEESGDRWTTLRVHLTYDGAELNVVLPLLTVLGWFVAVAVNVRLLAGAALRPAVRRAAARIVPLVLVGAMIVALTVGALYLGVVAATFAVGADSGGGLGLAIGAAVAIAGLFAPARLTLAVPALLIEQCDTATALRRAVGLTQGRIRAHGAAVVAVGAVVPIVAFAAAASVADRLAASGAPVWLGVGSVLVDVALIAAVPLQAAVLVGAYRAALTEQGTPSPRGGAVVAPQASSASRLFAGASVTLLVVVPTVVTSAMVAANPLGLPVVTIAYPSDGTWVDAHALTVLDDGALATVDYGTVAVCRDTLCNYHFTATMPCLDGGTPQPEGAPMRSCSTEGPISAADITPDGMLLALIPRIENGVRLMWCHVEPVRDGQCEWQGATMLNPSLPHPMDNLSMGVAARPDGGYAVALFGLGDDRGQVLLATCDQLECPQPTIKPVLDVALTDGMWGTGVVDIDVDQISGALALGYYDANDGTVWLGGCSAACADGPELTRVGSWPLSSPGSPAGLWPDLAVVATPTGPAAVLTMRPVNASFFPSTRFSVAIDCDDLACRLARTVGPDRWAAAAPVADRHGNAFIVGNPYREAAPELLDARTGSVTALVGEGYVEAAAFGPDDRLRIVLTRPEQRAAVVTCATRYCTR